MMTPDLHNHAVTYGFVLYEVDDGSMGIAAAPPDEGDAISASRAYKRAARQFVREGNPWTDQNVGPENTRTTDATTAPEANPVPILLSSTRDDDLDRTIRVFRLRLRSADHQLAIQLEHHALFARDPMERSLALDILAGARVDAFHVRVVHIIKQFLLDRDEDVRVSGIAAGSFLPRSVKVGLRDQVRVAIAAGASQDMQRAGTAFLRES